MAVYKMSQMVIKLSASRRRLKRHKQLKKKIPNAVITNVHLTDLDEPCCKEDAESCSHSRLCNHVTLFAGTLPEGDSGRDHRWRPGREPGPRDHRSRGQRDGDHPLEPDAGHSEEARVHVAPSAQDLDLSDPILTQPVSSKTLASSRSFRLSPCMVSICK